MVGIGGEIDARWYGNVLQARALFGAIVGLNTAAEALKSASQELSPKDTGALQNSATIWPASQHELASRVVYNAGVYAIVVHEGVRLDRPLRIKRGKNPKAQTKYLSTPLKRDRDKLNAIIANSVRRAIYS